MNERINGLWWKARIGYNNQNCDPEVLEKFAELIVAECLNEIQSLLDCNTQVDEFEQGVYNGLDMAKDCIKEHFGVEE